MTADDVLRSVAEAYAGFVSIQAEGLELSLQEDGGFTQRSEEAVRFSYERPNRARIERTRKGGAIVVSDGTHSHFLAHGRYFAGDARQTPGLFRPEFPSSGDLSFLYHRIHERVVAAELVGTETIRLSDRDMSCLLLRVSYDVERMGGFLKAVSPVSFWFDPETWVVVRREVEVTIEPPHQRESQTIRHGSLLTKFTLNAPISQEVFEFTPPDDAEVMPTGMGGSGTSGSGRGVGGVMGSGGGGFRDARQGVERQTRHQWEGDTFTDVQHWKFKGHAFKLERRLTLTDGGEALSIVERAEGPKGAAECNLRLPLV